MGWQVTATTVQCTYVNDFATIMVNSDLTAKCAYVNRHEGTKAGKKKLRDCKWPDCPIVKNCREEMVAL